MPKISLISHLGLLLVLSILAFPRMFGGDVPRALTLAVVAVVLAVVLTITEVFSGLRWVVLFVLTAAVVGLVATICGHGTAISTLWAWNLAWAAVVLWFAVLASRARNNR